MADATWPSGTAPQTPFTVSSTLYSSELAVPGAFRPAAHQSESCLAYLQSLQCTGRAPYTREHNHSYVQSHVQRPGPLRVGEARKEFARRNHYYTRRKEDPQKRDN